MKEVWKDCPKGVGYKVSNLGNVTNKKGLILKPYLNAWGYCRVSIGGKKENLARLVLETFIGPMPSNIHAAHLNGNRVDNRLTNLKWCTIKENHSHKRTHGTMAVGERHGSAKLTAKDVTYIYKYYKRSSYCRSNAVKLAQRFGVSKKTITEIASGSAWKCQKQLAEDSKLESESGE